MALPRYITVHAKYRGLGGQDHRSDGQVHVCWVGEDLPDLLASLRPYFAEFMVAKLTRSPELWQSCYARLLADK